MRGMKTQREMRGEAVLEEDINYSTQDLVGREVISLTVKGQCHGAAS